MTLEQVEAGKNILESSQNYQNKVVLFIHGIIGHPNQFKDFYAVIPSDYAQCSILLKGHGGEVDDFSKAKMQDWHIQVDQKIAELSLNYSEIYIVAHSMGALFTLQRMKYPKVKAAFLLAVPLKIKFRIKPFFTKIKSMINYQKNPSGCFDPCYGVEPDLRFWKYLKWAPNYLSLFKEIRKTNKLLKNGFAADKEILVFQSKNDELVNIKATQILQKAGLKVTVLEHSSHHQYSNKDLKRILDDFQKWLSKYCFKSI